MGAYDTDLPKLKVPGMENPPAAMPLPTTDPMAGFKKQFADLASATQVAGQTMSAPAPKPAPLHAPDTGSSVLPALQAGDAAMRAAPGAIADAATAGWNGLKGAVTPPSSNYVGNGPTDPDTNKRPVNPPVSVGGAVSDIYNKMIGNPLQSAIASMPDYNANGGVDVRAAAPAAAPDPFAYRGTPPPAPTTAKADTPERSGFLRRTLGDAATGLAKGVLVGTPQAAVGLARLGTLGMADPLLNPISDGLNNIEKAINKNYSPEHQQQAKEVADTKGFLPTIGTPPPAPTTAKVDTPAKADTPAPAATGPTKENGYAIPEIAPKTPSAGTQELIDRQNASRTPVSDPYSGPAAGMVPPPGGAEGSIGVAGFQKQLQNIRALDDGVTGGFNALSDPTEAENAEKTKRWAMGDIADAMKRAGTRTERAALGQLLNTMANNNSQQTISAGQQRTQREVAQGNNAAHLQGVVMQGDTQRAVAQGNNNAHLQGITMQGANQRAMGMMDNATRLQVAGLDNSQKQQELAERVRGNNLMHEYHTKSLEDTKEAREQQRALEARRLDITENEPAATQPVGMLPGSYITKNNRVVDQSAVNAKLIAEAEKRRKASGG